MKHIRLTCCLCLLQFVVSSGVQATRTSRSFYDPLLFDDLIVRGVVQSTSLITIERGEWSPTTPDIAHESMVMMTVQMDVLEVLKGHSEKKQLAFYHALTANLLGAVKQGGELILCLQIADFFRPGSYALYSPDGVFASGEGGWVRWSDHERLTTYEITERIKESDVEHLIEEAEVIAVGVVTSIRDVRLPGQRVDDLEYTLRIESLLKGTVEENIIKFVAHKWVLPEPWIPYTPWVIELNQKWYVFLKKRDSYYYPFAGANGLLRIDKGNLVYDNRVEHEYGKAELDRLVSKSVPHEE